ncbi:MAG: hypothetical protein L3I99_03965 [Sulfurimonas sp.]|nr:hypothetical protein [Sulfurimonas sp.]
MLIQTLYTIQYQDAKMGVIKLSDARHPIFKAHFPSHPILPGFMHLEIISKLFEIEIISIKKAKFLKLALPEQILKYEKNKNKFKVLCDEEEIASFSI